MQQGTSSIKKGLSSRLSYRGDVDYHGQERSLQIHIHFDVVAVGSIPDQRWHGKLPQQIMQYLSRDNRMPLMATENRESKSLRESMRH